MGWLGAERCGAAGLLVGIQKLTKMLSGTRRGRGQLHYSYAYEGVFF